MKLHYIVPACILFSTSMSVNADFSLGVGIGASTQIYKKYDTQFAAFPIIAFEKHNFYFTGLSAGYVLAQDSNNELTLGVYYYALKFKPGDTDDLRLRQLKRRRDTMMGNVGYAHTRSWGELRGNFSFDTLDRSNAMIIDAGYSYPLALSMQWTIKPGIGFTWASQKHNRYYFGVTQQESIRSGLAHYKPCDSWSYYAQIKNDFAFSDRWNGVVIIRGTIFDDEIKDSPMVDKKYNTSVLAGISYAF